MRMLYLFSISFVSLNFLFFSVAKSQEQIVKKDSLYSQILKENRSLHIVFPKNYNPDITDNYEIVYCLDDISDFIALEWGMLQWEGFVPKNMIMVGITNPKPNGLDMRDRDFTPTKISDISGGAKTFLSFFKNELIPFINAKYKGASDGNVLYGGSLGGLFVMYAFLNDPNLFTSYIAIDPSLWWDNFLLTKIASDRFDSIKYLHNTLFIAGREGNAFKEMGIYAMDSLLRIKAPAGLIWECDKYSNETHYSTNFKGFWDGLKLSYGGFYASTGGYATSRKIAIKPKNGLVLKDVPFKLICYNLMAKNYLHFTTNGADPTLSSPTLSGDETPISLQSNSKVIVKSIGAREKYNRIDSGYFKIGSAFEPVAKPRNIRQGGLHYQYYEGVWDTIPDFKHIKPLKSGLADKNFDINQFTKTKNYVCLMDGFIEISKAGYYIFEMGDGNEFSKVYLNHQQILGTHFVKGDGENYLIPLRKGFYPFHIVYFHKKGTNNLQPVYLKPENIEDFPINAEMLYWVE
jgi:predicted alpha/beta superfamily hydrolase